MREVKNNTATIFGVYINSLQRTPVIYMRTRVGFTEADQMETQDKIVTECEEENNTKENLSE